MSTSKKNILLSDFLVPVRRAMYVAGGFVDMLFNRTAPQVFILCYHSAADDGGRFSMDAAVIHMQIAALAKHYTPVSLADVTGFLVGTTSFDTPSFAVTFDDGYASLMALKHLPTELGVKPTVFALSTPEKADRNELASQESFLDTKELQELHSMGWEIGCHGATHVPLPSADDVVLTAEISQAKKTLEDALGFAVPYFAYPKGAYSENAIQAVKKAGFMAAFTMDDGQIRPHGNVYTVPRIGVDKTHSMREFHYLWSPTVTSLRAGIKSLVSV